jgi:hypothetical protein
MGLGQKRISQLSQERFNDVIVDSGLTVTPSGKVFYVDSNLGASTYSGTRRASPFATLAQAYAACTASAGDVIIVSPFHAETVTAVLTVAKIGVRIIGEKLGNKRAVITPNGAIDAISLEAAGCSVSGLEFGIPGTDAQTADINIAAANCAVVDTLHHASTTSNNKVNVITLTSAANYALLDGVIIYNTTVEVPSAIKIEGALTGAEIKNCFVFDTIGYTDGALVDAATALSLNIHHNTFKNAKAAAAVVAFGSNSTGIFHYNNVSGRHTTIASNITTGTGIDFFQTFTTEQASLNGGIIPAADAD